MKIKKPEDEKYFKDIVLNDILEEISNENGDSIVNTTQAKKRKNSRKKFSVKTLLFIIIAVLLILFITTLFRLVTDATTEIIPIPQPPIETSKHDTAQTWKMDEDRAGYKEIVPPKEVKEKHIPKKEILNKTIEIKPVKSEPLPKKKSERELAKEALHQQMLN